MLYINKKKFNERTNFKSLSNVKTFVYNMPGLSGKVFDAAETQSIPDGCFAFFKNKKTPDLTLYFIKKEITPQKIGDLADKYGWEIDGAYKNPSSKKIFTISYRGMTINCSWSGGPSGASNTNTLTDLKEYATKVAFESGSVDYNDDDQVATVMQFIDEKIAKDYPSLEISDDLVESYAVSALKSSAEFYKKYGIDPDFYDFDRQNEDPRSKAIYSKAIELGVKKIDNWNPGDIWAFSDDLTLSQIKSDIRKFTTLSELNAYIDNMMGGRENDDLSSMKIIPISLKKVDLKKQVNVTRMDSNKATEIVSSILEEGLEVEAITFNGRFRRFNILLSNGYIIQVFNSLGGVGATRWELQKPGAGAKSGNVDKANIIIPYIFEGDNETDVQASLFGVEKEERKKFLKFIDKLYALPNANLIKQSKDSLVKRYNEACDAAIASGDTGYPDTIVTEVVAAYYGVKNILKSVKGQPLILTMFLSGLKIADGQCSYIKIYS